MKKGFDIKKIGMILLVISLLILPQGFYSEASTNNLIKVKLDGKYITSFAKPIVQNDKILLPIEFIAEKLGAEVYRNYEYNIITIKKGNNLAILHIDSRLVIYQNEGKSCELSDVPTRIINDKVYVSYKLFQNIFGVKVKYNEDRNKIYIYSNKKADIEPLFDVEISSVEMGQTINGKTDLKISFDDDLDNASEIKYLLLNPETASGVIIARGNKLDAEYNWIPSLEESGERVLVSAIYDSNGNFIAGDAVLVNIEVNPKVFLIGLEQNDYIDDNVSLSVDTNFLPSYVEYEITNLHTGEVILSGKTDPWGTYTWVPMVENNGEYSFRVIAYDSEDNGYSSSLVTAKIEVPRKLELRGVSEGDTINNPVRLSTFRNFHVSETEYVLEDLRTGKEEILKKFGYGSYSWFPGPEYSGEKALFVRVKDTRGKTHESEKINVTIKDTPKVILEGIGPNQVITKPVELKVSSNVNLSSVDYIFTNKDTGKKVVIASNQNPSDSCVYTPNENDEGEWIVKAVGKYKWKSIESEEIPIKVYLGETYGPKPIIEKDKFMEFASQLAKNSWEKTGMSAALQTAQAILETGWGQSVPVDKYSGQLSYNLFGIKGEGTNGYVISNTWEQYNGQIFRVDAKFRAYNNVEESWADHKNLLLKLDRYKPFREVMYDYTQGAWAIKRAGYATDSMYPLKLMRIIKQYNLQELDKVKI